MGFIVALYFNIVNIEILNVHVLLVYEVWGFASLLPYDFIVSIGTLIVHVLQKHILQN